MRMSHPGAGTRVWYEPPDGEREEGTVDDTRMSDMVAMVADDGTRLLVLWRTEPWGVVIGQEGQNVLQ